MEAWRLLLGLTGMLVLYAALGTVLGFGLSAGDVVAAIIFGSVGLYLGEVLTSRMNAEKKE